MMLPLAARVYLACGFTDMRNYAEWLVMLRSQSRPQFKQWLTASDPPSRSA